MAVPVSPSYALPACTFWVLFACFPGTDSFTARLPQRSSCEWSISANGNGDLVGNTRDLPLLDIPEDEDENEASTNFIFPLPTGSFPDELRTCSIHATTVILPLHKAILDAAAQNTPPLVGFCCGAVDSSPSGGCVAEVVRWDSASGELQYRGEFLFRTQEVLNTIPFRTASVEAVKILYSSTVDKSSGEVSPREELSYKDNMVLQEMLDHLTTFVDQSVEETSSLDQMSPLEASLQPPPSDLDADKTTMTQERAAIATILCSSLELFAPPSIPFLAVDLLAQHSSNRDRLSLLRCSTVSERIQTAKEILQELVSQGAASTSSRTTFAASSSVQAPIVDTDLQVGPPQLPPWASRITKGTELEYFWNEEYEWCRGVVMEDPVWIVDEWILTVHFDDDNSTHRLPLTADDKARWRPASSFG